MAKTITKMSKADERRWRREKAEAAGLARAYSAQQTPGIGAWQQYQSLLGKVYAGAVKGDPRALAAVENWPQQPVEVLRQAREIGASGYDAATFRSDLDRSGVRL